MSLATMIAEMRGVVPGYSALLARTHLRESWRDIRNLRGWSFQLAQGGFTTPPLVNQGAATVTFGDADVLFDAAATAAINQYGSQYGSLITQRQFRVGASTIYNIVAAGNNGELSYATIDTPGSGQTPGTYTVSVTDNQGAGTGASVRIIVNPDGTVTLPPVVITPGDSYVDPAITLTAGGSSATFTAVLGLVLTLDRPWTDVTGTAVPPPPSSTIGYSIYQCYYTAPVKGFQAWESIMDVVNVIWLNTQPSKAERDRINRMDPQRQIFSNPGTVLSVGADARPGSSTPGYMMFELYPQPQAMYSYQTWYSWDGPELDNPTDNLPFPISEDCLKAKARTKAYEWAEANRDTLNPRGQNADYRFLYGVADAAYLKALKEIRMIDRDLYDAWKNTMTRLSGLGPLATSNQPGHVQSRNL